MRSRHLVAQDLAPFVDLIPSPPASAEELAAVRAQQDTLFPDAPPNDVDVRLVSIAGARGGAIGVRIYTPANQAPGRRACLVHFHGGGFVSGSARMMDFTVRPLAAELDCVIVSVDYRLAPEFPHPVPAEDCYAGLSWAIANADQLCIDSSNVGLIGESAGGGLAASVSLLARDRKGPQPAFQVLIYPMLDDRTAAKQAHPFAGEFVWTLESNRFAWEALLGKSPGSDDVAIYAAPARANELGGLPATYLDVGSLDLFIDENIDFAARLIRAGVPTEFHVYPGAFHGFDLLPGTRLGTQAHANRLQAIRRFMGR